MHMTDLIAYRRQRVRQAEQDVKDTRHWPEGMRQVPEHDLKLARRELERDSRNAAKAAKAERERGR